MQFGFQHLVLLNSAGYSRAELPLDGAVSLVAPNNRGKTSLINALQFLLIIDRRRMDFGAHDVDKSRRFYFPSNSSYVLLEVSLPESGTMVLGCVGKGVSSEYEYFAYAGQLDVEEFRLPDGALVSQPQLASHLATHQRRVFSYSGSEFANMVYGGRSRKLGGQQDFCVFRLEHANDAATFQRVLTRTLRLDKLRSSEVKDYLLQIFQRDLPDASIDFKAEWDKAFADLNAERSQYQAACKLQKILEELEKGQQERLELRGKLLVWRPMMEDALAQWQRHFETRQHDLECQLLQFDGEMQRMRAQDIQLVRDQSAHELEQSRLCQERERLAGLQQRFALVPEKSLLVERRRELEAERDTLIVRIGQAQSREPRAIRRELQRLAQELAQLDQEIRTQGSSLYQQLATQLPPEQLAALNQVLARPVLTLDAGSFALNAQDLSAALEHSDEHTLALPGLELRLHDLHVQYQQRTLAELAELVQEQEHHRRQLEQQLATAEELETVQQQRQALEQQLVQLDAELRDYTEMVALQQGDTDRQDRLAELAGLLTELALTISESAQRHLALDQRRQQLQQELASLRQQHRQIEQRRNLRQDHEGQFAWLADLPHHPWLGQPQFALDELAERLQTYLSDCRRLKDLDENIRHLLSEIHSAGLTKYQFVDADRKLTIF
jgi:hypothetical protein